MAKACCLFTSLFSCLWITLPFVAGGSASFHLEDSQSNNFFGENGINQLKQESEIHRLRDETTLDSSNKASTAPSHPMVQWLLSFGGGFVSDKLDFRSDGVYTMMDIDESEKLMTIPQAVLIQQEHIKDWSACSATLWLVDQYIMLEEDSEYWPFIQYLFETLPEHHLPSGWSDEAKKLVKDIVVEELEPRRFGESTFDNECPDVSRYNYRDDNLNTLYNKLLKKGWKIFWSRSWNGNLIPLFDMVNHRNGYWHNLDLLDPSDKYSSNGFEAVALRNISAGEQLYSSYSDCATFFCRNLNHTLVAPALFDVYGFVESYPRRWAFDTGYNTEVLHHGFVFEVEEQVVDKDSRSSDTKRLVVKWLTGEPSNLEINWFHANFKRLKGMAADVAERANLLDNPIERDMVLDYYEALAHDIELAYHWAREGHALEHENRWEENTCSAHGLDANRYDDLEDKPDTLDYAFDITSNCQLKYDATEVVDFSRSSFQTIKFEHVYYPDIGKRDTCLTLAEFPQSCSSFRSHYHEILVHYPASFLKDVKRVLFVGGGDIMILHELLKYDVEFIYGMELDQQVVRHSFRNYGIQPQFDNPKVRWSFGDAAKNMFMLPKEYYGTFDLVLIDLQTYVADTVSVAEGVSLMDMGMRLLKPDGVLAQNQDFAQRDKPYFARYGVNMIFDDIPHFCRQYINMASNGVDFSRTTPKDHQVPALYYEPRNEKYYGSWTGYHNNIGQGENKATLTELQPDSSKSFGLMSFVEAEEATIDLGNSTLVGARIRQVVKEMNLTELNSLSFSMPEDDAYRNYVLNYVLEEGLIVARVFPGLNYTSMDFHLWTNFEIYDEVLIELVQAVGSKLNGSASSYRLATGGMLGITTTLTAEVPRPSFEETRPLVPETIASPEEILEGIVSELALLIPSLQQNMVVLCPEDKVNCHSMDSWIQMSNASVNAVPMRACPDLNNADLQALFKCEEETRETMKKVVEESGRFDSILIDPHAPREMGQIIHKVLNSTLTRRELLASEFVVIAPSPSSSSTDPWRSALLERFRQSIVYNPVYHVGAAFHSSADTLQVDIFSAGDPSFYSRLTKVGAAVKSKMGLDFEIENGRSGVVSHSPDFKPSKILTNEDYDVREARRQFLGQTAVAQHGFLQFEIDLPPIPISVGEMVLSNNHMHNWDGAWFPCEVIHRADDDMYTALLDNKHKFQVHRKLIRRMDHNQGLLSMGQRVLMKSVTEESGEIWRQGYIMSLNADGSYRVRIMTLDADLVADEVKRGDLIPQIDETAPLDPSFQMTPSKLVGVLEMTLHNLTLTDTEVTLVDNVGEGCILFAAWSEGNVIVTWDGKTHVDINLFTALSVPNIFGDTLESTFKREFQLALLSWDSMPRGIGRIVNFPIGDGFWFGMLGEVDFGLGVEPNNELLMQEMDAELGY